MLCTLKAYSGFINVDQIKIVKKTLENKQKDKLQNHLNVYDNEQ